MAIQNQPNMELDYIIKNDVIGRYVAGELSDDEALAFEYAYFTDAELAALVETEQFLQAHYKSELKPANTVWYRSLAYAAGFAVMFILATILFEQTSNIESIVLSTKTPTDISTVLALKPERGGVPGTRVTVSQKTQKEIVLSVGALPTDSNLLVFSLLNPDGQFIPIVPAELNTGDIDIQTIYFYIPVSLLQEGEYQLTATRKANEENALSRRFWVSVIDS